VARRRKVRKRSPLLPLRPFFFRETDGAASVHEAINSVEADLFRRMQECDEDEGLCVAKIWELLLRTRRAMSEGDARSAVRYALELGMMARYVDHTFSYGASLERGEKFDDALLHAAESKANRFRLRNARMAREFLKRLPSWDGSKTALMREIGKKERLGRSASIEAVESGLKTVRSKAKPDN
jgi:hypothetical protein